MDDKKQNVLIESGKNKPQNLVCLGGKRCNALTVTKSQIIYFVCGSK